MAGYIVQMKAGPEYYERHSSLFIHKDTFSLAPWVVNMSHHATGKMKILLSARFLKFHHPTICSPLFHVYMYIITIQKDAFYNLILIKLYLKTEPL